MKTKFCITTILFYLSIVYAIIARDNNGSIIDIEGVNLFGNRSYAGSTDPDTLQLENGEIYVLKQTPLTFFDGYADLFSDYKATVRLMGQTKGFSCKWIIESGQLYLKDINFGGGVTSFEKTSDGKSKPVYHAPPPPSIIKDRIEKLTGRNSNEEGLLPADWTSGKFAGYQYKSHLDRDNVVLLPWEKEYQFTFKNGQLTTIHKIEFIDVTEEKLEGKRKTIPKYLQLPVQEREKELIDVSKDSKLNEN